ncbi:exodeoxyribonuclease VII large subunit [Synechococcus sp. Tobar12-5m-g]|uniref:exodeoxyribonuclease VII large subunit n=1 Tax=unclassified Synechococcus TaxID=2626047 RepID=UPI0020CCA8B2|nr:MULTISPECIES: exodeoxyribonuclease VII large subunit [unclassified Synechococcus]MCP9772712.1 exodeoxyribonuclease VII large subunit [Synechococcus sp. Tobar12-5m-g]MCP9873434.1 exodeoxyribonuclease VII large subunit [Synechococcus sp. Cruz CV-v-12]
MNAEAASPAAFSVAKGLPLYSVAELTTAIGKLLERGFAPRFLLAATVSRPQLKKGHLWMTLTDGDASISAVAWATQLPKLSFRPSEGDGVTVVGKLNFWPSRASLCVQVLDIRPSLSSVLRRFERVRQLLEPTGLFAPGRKRRLPEQPATIALLTSVPSSALADMLRTAAERWPATRIILLPIPVQGPVEAEICRAIRAIGARAEALGVEALVLARGGGSREDLSVFDGEDLALALADCPIPVVTGLGHEDDTTVADLVADYRAATPTAALVALLPDRHSTRQELQAIRQQLSRQLSWRLRLEQERADAHRQRLRQCQPGLLLQRQQRHLRQMRQALEALSPQHLLKRGFCLVRGDCGQVVRSVHQIEAGSLVELHWADGKAKARITGLQDD